MWKRLTERARRVVFAAQEAAQDSGELYVSTEHLLLGLLSEADDMGARVLSGFGLTADEVRAAVEVQVPRSERRATGEITLTPRGKRVIDLAYDEARALDNEHIGTEHLLLGLIRERDGVAGRVLGTLGVELDEARGMVEAMQVEAGVRSKDAVRKPTPDPPRPHDPWDRFDDAAQRAAMVAHEESRRRGLAAISPDHLLLGLLAEVEIERLLGSLNVDCGALRKAMTALGRTFGLPYEGRTVYSPASCAAFLHAYEARQALDAPKTTAEHLLLGLLVEPDGVAGRLLARFGVDPERLTGAIRG